MKLKMELRKATAFSLAFAFAALGGISVARSDPSRSGNALRRSVATAVSTAKAASTVVQSVNMGVISAVTTVTHTISPLDSLLSSQVPFGSIILREAKKNGVAPELVAAVIEQESRFIPNARSPRGAIGLMQLLPATGRWMGAHNLTNPAQNIAAGTRYLKYLSDRFGGNETKMIAAYNAGEGNVRRFGGLPPFRETRTYVHNVLKFRDQFVGEARRIRASA